MEQYQLTLEEVLFLIVEASHQSSASSSFRSLTTFSTQPSQHRYTIAKSSTAEPELQDILNKYDEIMQKYQIEEYPDRTIYKSLLSLSLTPGDTWFERLHQLFKVC